MSSITPHERLPSLRLYSKATESTREFIPQKEDGSSDEPNQEKPIVVAILSMSNSIPSDAYDYVSLPDHKQVYCRVVIRDLLDVDIIQSRFTLSLGILFSVFQLKRILPSNLDLLLSPQRRIKFFEKKEWEELTKE